MSAARRVLDALKPLATRVAGGVFVGALAGCSSALFLWLLDRVTETRAGAPRLVYLLPLAGLVLGFAFERWGAPIQKGTSLVIERARGEEAGAPRVPIRMAPMVLAGTLVTHLFGGSAGREGTAVQMSASLADAWFVRFGLDASARRDLVAASIAAGFGAVFGTPIAGAIFGVEVLVARKLVRGAMRPSALLPAVIGALIGDRVARLLGAHHAPYPVVPAVPVTLLTAGKWVLFGAAIAFVAAAFIVAVEGLKRGFGRLGARLPLRMLVGGAAVVGLYCAVGVDDYLGLGVPTILRSFSEPAVPWSTFALKLLFTVVTLGAGFIGGEVTPLFFIGAALGSTLAGALHVPVALGAALGMAGMFGAASNTPIALAVMAMELVGAGAFPHVLAVTVIATLLKGRRSIYSAQLVEPPGTRG